MRDKLSCNSEMICAVRAVEAGTTNRSRSGTRRTTVADKRCAGPCLFRTCAGLHWGNQPARVVASDGDGDGVGVINRERVKRPSGIVANGKYGNALSVICANYVPPTPMPDQGCEPRVANAVQSLECSHVLMANGVNENRQHQHEASSAAFPSLPFAAEISTWQLAAVAH